MTGSRRSAPTIVYIAAEYPHARGVKWMRSLAAAGVRPFVAYGRGRESLWNAEAVDPACMVHDPRLRRKIHFRTADIASRIQSALKSEELAPQAILVRDVFLTPIARRLSRLVRCPWVLDLCDNYPEVARQNTELRRPWIRLGAPLIQTLEARAVRDAAATVFVSPESRSLVLSKGRGGADKPTFIVENAPWMEREEGIETSGVSGKNLVYIGTVDANIRDFGTVVRGLDLYNKKYREQIYVDLLTFNREKAQLQLDRTGVDWRRYIRIEPAVPAAELPNVLPQYLAGLVPHFSGAAVDYTISNKIFDYLFAGTPVLASDNPPNVRLIEQVGGGRTYRRESPESFADELRTLRLEGADKTNTDVLLQRYSWQRQSADAVAFLCSQ